MSDRYIFSEEYPRGIRQSELDGLRFRENYIQEHPEAEEVFQEIDDLIADAEARQNPFAISEVISDV